MPGSVGAPFLRDLYVNALYGVISHRFLCLLLLDLCQQMIIVAAVPWVDVYANDQYVSNQELSLLYLSLTEQQLPQQQLASTAN